VFVLGSSSALIAANVSAQVFLVLDEPDLVAVLFENLCRPVGRSVVHHDDLLVGIRQSQCRLDRFADELLLLVTGNDQAECWHRAPATAFGRAAGTRSRCAEWPARIRGFR